MNFETITTRRLILRKIDPESYKFIFENYAKNEIRSFFAIGTEDAFEKEKEKYEKGLTTYNKSFVHFQILDKNTDAFLGTCGFHTWYLQHARAELGYELLNETERKKGLMTEALYAVIDYGFNQMNLHRIEAFVAPTNIASLRLMQKLKFTEEGLLRQHYCKDGVMENSKVFSLLKHEYYANP